jgi:hypothetical protein
VTLTSITRSGGGVAVGIEVVVPGRLQRGEPVAEHCQSTSVVVIELGAGTAVPTVRYECQRQGGTLIRINVREAQVPPEGISLPLQALTA